MSSGYQVDLTPPNVKFLRDSKNGYKYITSNDEMYATWRFADDESGISEYRSVIHL